MKCGTFLILIASSVFSKGSQGRVIIKVNDNTKTISVSHLNPNNTPDQQHLFREYFFKCYPHYAEYTIIGMG
jgi:hypothetical protein